MSVAKNMVVSIDYKLTDEEGEVLDSSEDTGPLEYLHGHGEIVPGLERALEGKKSGDSLQVKVDPKDGYGEYDPEKVVEIDKDQLPEGMNPELGMELTTDGPNGEPVTYFIAEIEDDGVVLDGNHPLAGETLNFDITIRGLRPATKEELSHGHAHGPDGHHH